MPYSTWNISRQSVGREVGRAIDKAIEYLSPEEKVMFWKRVASMGIESFE